MGSQWASRQSSLDLAHDPISRRFLFVDLHALGDTAKLIVDEYAMEPTIRGIKYMQQEINRSNAHPEAQPFDPQQSTQPTTMTTDFGYPNLIHYLGFAGDRPRVHSPILLLHSPFPPTPPNTTTPTHTTTISQPPTPTVPPPLLIPKSLPIITRPGSHHPSD